MSKVTQRGHLKLDLRSTSLHHWSSKSPHGGLTTDQVWEDIFFLEPMQRSSGSEPEASQAPASLSCWIHTHPSVLFCSLSKIPYCFPPTVISEALVFVCTIDVKSWLVMFGFQLSNIIPGFPRAKMYFVPPPYELSESQASENGQVSGGSCQEHEGLSPFPFANRTAWEPRARGQRGKHRSWV